MTRQAARFTGNVGMEKDGESCLDRPENKRRSVRDAGSETIHSEDNCIDHVLRREGLSREVSWRAEWRGRGRWVEKEWKCFKELCKKESYGIMKGRAEDGILLRCWMQ